MSDSSSCPRTPAVAEGMQETSAFAYVQLRGQLPSCLTQPKRGHPYEEDPTRICSIRHARSRAREPHFHSECRTAVGLGGDRGAETGALVRATHPWTKREPSASSRLDRRRPGGAARCLRQSASRRAREEGSSGSLGWKNMASENILLGCAVGGIAGAGTGTAFG